MSWADPPWLDALSSVLLCYFAPSAVLCKFKTLSTSCGRPGCPIHVLGVCVCVLACLPYKFKQCWKHAALALFNHAPHTHTHIHRRTRTSLTHLLKQRQAFMLCSPSQKCCIHRGASRTIYMCVCVCAYIHAHTAAALAACVYLMSKLWTTILMTIQLNIRTTGAATCDQHQERLCWSLVAAAAAIKG